MMEWQERVVTEKYDLDEKIDKLQTFCDGIVMEGLPTKTQALLIAQLMAMINYSAILGARLA